MAEDIDYGVKNLRRREFLIAGAAAGVAATVPLNYGAITRAKAAPVAKGGKFAHGISSGYPGSKAITLWTRVSELDRTSKLTLEIAKDKGFDKIVKSKQVTAEKGDDFTIHERVAGLKPGSQYYYRFETKNKTSKVGRFRTLPPADSNQPLRIAYYSCQDFQAGYYNVQAAIAEEDVDLVICLGDYMYERGFFGGPTDRVDETGANGDGNVQTLSEYRDKYHLYQSDKDLQAMHAAHPFISVWDDHEVEDNYAGDDPDSAEPDRSLENNGEPRRIPFEDRRKNGYKAYFEAHPRVRIEGDRNRIYGSVRLGGLAELFLTDQRQYRDPQPCMDAQLTACPEAFDPGRKFLGDEQKKWFKKAVPASSAKWKLWGSEVMVMSVDVPAGQPAILDSWDGYDAERKEILESWVAKGLENLAVLTGDIHTFFAGDVTTTGRVGGDPVGVELVGGSATSLGIPEALGVSSATLHALAEANDPHVKFAEFDKRGYGVVEVEKKKLTGHFKTVDALTKGAAAVPLKSFEVLSGDPTVHEVS